MYNQSQHENSLPYLLFHRKKELMMGTACGFGVFVTLRIIENALGTTAVIISDNVSRITAQQLEDMSLGVSITTNGNTTRINNIPELTNQIQQLQLSIEDLSDSFKELQTTN